MPWYRIPTSVVNKTMIQHLERIGYHYRYKDSQHYLRGRLARSALFRGPRINSSSSGRGLHEFLKQHSPMQWVTPGTVVADDEIVMSLLRRAKDTDTLIDYIEYLSRAIVFCDPSRLETFLTQSILPVFFERYPGGTVIPVASNRDIFTSVSLLNHISLFSALGYVDRLHKDLGFGTLRQADRDNLPRMKKVLGVGLYAFYPYFHGFLVECKPGLNFVFVLDQPFEIKPRYPWDIFDIMRTTNMFDEDTSDTVVDLLTGRVSSKSLHKRYVSNKWSHEDFLRWIEFWIDSVNKLVLDILNMTNFLENNELKPVTQFQYFHSLSRLISTAVLINSDRSPMTRKVFTMQFLDIVSDAVNLVKPNPPSESEIFLKLLSKGTLRNFIESALQKLPEPFRTHFLDMSREVYADVYKVALEGLWLPQKDATGRIIETYRGTTNTYHTDEYVPALLRAIRNSHHGYGIDKFTSMLMQHTGNISNYLPDLSLIITIAIIADPLRFREADWLT